MFQLSSLKLLATVFFALVILSACGGGGGGATAPATATPAVTSCTDANQHVVDNVCTNYTSQTCLTDGKFFDSTNTCVARITVDQCSDDSHNGVDAATNTCATFTAATCPDSKFWNSSTSECVVKVTSCTNQYLDADNNQCIAYTQATCPASKYWDNSANDCVVKITSCTNANQHVVDNACTNYTSATCQTDGKFFDTTDNSCVTKISESDCMTMGYKGVNASTNICNNPYVATEAGFYTNAEYNQSGALESVKAAEAYANIATLIAADTTGTIKQAGAGQTVSLYVAVNAKFDYVAGDFAPDEEDLKYDASYAGLADTTNPIFVTGYDTTSQADVAQLGDCGEEADATAIADCKNRAGSKQFTHHLNALAGRKDAADVATPTGIHGIAYDANIKIINSSSHPFSNTSADIANAIKQGGGANIAAMINTTTPQDGQTKTIDGTSRSYNRVYLDGIADVTYHPAWKNVVGNGTIIISKTGEFGGNSVNGMVKTYTSVSNRTNDINPTLLAATTVHGSVANANRAAYSTDITHDDFKGKWLAVTGVDENNVILSKNNACGAAAQYCLSVPELEMPANDGTAMLVSPDYILGGALAVIRGAYPNLTVAQTVALTLGTADYLDDDADDSTDAIGLVDDTTGKYNAVYGHGLLNLDAATSLSEADASDANIISSSSSPIGAIWGDTKLTLSSHFGAQLSRVNLGVQDKYGRHFILDAQNSTSAPVAAASFDEYIGNMLADNVQSQKLGTQAKLNYSNNGQPWMDLEYKAGKATSKIAFQDNYKISPLNDSGATSILRANHIRPASNNIGMMDVDYQLGNALTLSSYLARGEYDTGYKFDELGTDFDVNYKQSHLNIAIGNIREHGQFLGTNTSGAYALNAPSISRFTDVTYGHDLGGKFNIYANYINYETDVDMLHDQFASIDGLQADQYQIGFTGKDLISKDDSLNIALITKLGVTDGALNQNTVLGYTEDGGFNNASQSYDLAVNNRHQQFEITYQGKLYQNADKISNFRDNRFFTSIIVDSNLNHVEGASQVEVISGINIKY